MSTTLFRRIGAVAATGLAAVAVAALASGCSSKSKVTTGAPAGSSVAISSAVSLTASQKPSTVTATGGGKFCQQIAASINSATSSLAKGVTPGNLKETMKAQAAQFQLIEATVLKNAPTAIKPDLVIVLGAADKFYAALAKADFDYTKVDPSVLSAFSAPDVAAAEQRLTDYVKNTCGIDTGAPPPSATASAVS